jgi:hypothetical protein
MLAALIVLAAMDAAPTPAAARTTTPVVAAGTGQTRTLADVARERKLGKRPAAGGTLSVVGASGSPLPASGAVNNGGSEAEARLSRAIRDGAWVGQNIHYNEDIRERARREWDAAAENCRQTAGCTPVYRDPDVLPTGKEAARALQKKLGPDVDTPGR